MFSHEIIVDFIFVLAIELKRPKCALRFRKKGNIRTKQQINHALPYKPNLTYPNLSYPNLTYTNLIYPNLTYILT